MYSFLLEAESTLVQYSNNKKHIISDYSGQLSHCSDWATVQDFHARQGQVILCSPKRPDRPQGPHSLLCNGDGCSFSGTKRPDLEVYLSTPCSAEVKDVWICVSTPPCNDNDDEDDDDNNNNNNTNNVRFDVITLVY